VTPVEDRICSATGARRVERIAHLQAVWSGWGELARYRLVDGPVETVVVKHIAPAVGHPRGWSGSVGDARKRRSYEVEAAFYRRPPRGPRRAHAWLAEPDLFVLEDLDAAGFATRRTFGRLTDTEVRATLDALASFHAAHLHDPGDGLWPVGTYWHLDTRPDELAAMRAGPLRDAAPAIDARLRAATSTLVHGDAKVANVCYAPVVHTARDLALVDFQYTGRGPGIVDVVYFLGSCLPDDALHTHVDRYVGHHARALRSLLSSRDLTVSDEWRDLEDFAWADFERFLAGWAPGHAKRGTYAAARTARAMERLATT
jgi:hypothetical protein